MRYTLIVLRTSQGVFLYSVPSKDLVGLAGDPRQTRTRIEDMIRDGELDAYLVQTNHRFHMLVCDIERVVAIGA